MLVIYLQGFLFIESLNQQVLRINVLSFDQESLEKEDYFVLFADNMSW